MICVIHKFVCDFVFKVFVSKHLVFKTLKMEKIEKKLQETEDELKELKEEIKLFKEANIGWNTSPTQHYSNLVQKELFLMQKESKLEEEINSFGESATRQGNSIINYHKL